MTPINIWTSDKDVNLSLLGCKIEDLSCFMSIIMLDNTAQPIQESLFLSEYKNYCFVSYRGQRLHQTIKNKN